ncbi:sperm-tail PG-rich repeat-containing protein 2 [Oncorhynchus keta]|uniref:sperm-tail PG-rich repeat-containing protein 2 n=1 Tax=Oncorhynchus keta TaxID=8018 RepID=UPI00227A4D5C|nr:sperm-tail PG-rich repeat-containing protein 2 [Oncorhynchus keta]XP_052317067.1 sperm-tail PG-rich repeat-containing protein 2 [Oncorhynchus keta]
MYGRAPRVTYLTVGSTTSEVGPGSYEVIQFKSNKSDGYAPFLSLSKRPSMFHRSSNDKALPGPGQYNSSHSKDNILGGQSLKNRSKRFDEVVSEVPGPGTYNVRQAAGNTLRGAESEPPGKRRTKVWLRGVPTRLKFLPQPDIPSIPSPGQAFGYEDNGQGFLCKQKAPEKDDTLGPAFYNPVVAETSFSLKYKGVHFGKMTGKRGEVKGEEGPGPGQYDPEEYSTTEYENVNVRKGQKSRAELVVPRYHEIVTLQEEKKGVPGPGQYHIRSQFEKPNSPYGNLPVFSPPFLSQAQRFSPVKELAPPVGMYNDPRCALEILKKTTGMQRNPFGLTAVRFLPDSRKQSTPGPGAYNMFEYGLAQDSIKKAYLESTRKGGFGSTAQRSLVFHKNEEVPGPGQYKVEKKTEELYKKQHTAAFKSATERLAISLVAKDTPPPSSYNVRESFEKTYGRASFSEPRSEGGRRRQSSFLSAAPRHSSFLSYDPDFPGPGQYSPDIKSSPQMALIVSREDRFKGPKNTNPGPGTYELSPAIMDTVLKGTFNVTLNNPLSNHYPAPDLLSALPPPPLTLSSV